MANHDRLYNWWWSDAGPRNSEQMSIEEIVNILTTQRRNNTNIVLGIDGGLVTNSGWYYAVKKFLLVYCHLINADRDTFNATRNYSIWRHHLNSIVSVRQQG